jgi:hypothetical protein
MAGETAAWHLENVEAMAAAHPRTFFIPPAEVRRQLKRGDGVKLIFLLDAPAPGGAEAERMWVEIVSEASGRYIGKLLNQPAVIAGLNPGDRVDFGPEHVASIDVSERAIGYRVEDLAIVTRRLALADVRPGFLRRDESLRDSDSGWQLFLGDEPDEYFQDAENFGPAKLGFLTDKFPELEKVFRQGEPGQVWAWQDDTETYERVE